MLLSFLSRTLSLESNWRERRTDARGRGRRAILAKDRAEHREHCDALKNQYGFMRPRARLHVAFPLLFSSFLFFLSFFFLSLSLSLSAFERVWRTHFPSGPAKLPLDVVQLPSEFRKKGVDMSGRNDFLPGSARSILTAELMASPDVKVRRSNKELFGKGLPAFFHVVGSYTPSTFHQISSRWPPSR